MKKNLKNTVIFTLSTALLCSMVAFTQGDSLISKTFLEKTYTPYMEDAISNGIQEVMEPMVEAQKEELEQLWAEYSQQDMSRANDFTTLNLSGSRDVTLPQGSVVVGISGQLSIQKLGTLVDLSAGSEEMTQNLTIGHQYLVAENSSVTISAQSATAQVAVLGLYELGEGEAFAFTDVYASDWYYPSVDYVKTHNLFSGITDTEFGPLMSMDRGMVTAVFYRLVGSPEGELVGSTVTFLDVNDGDWYSSFVHWAVSQNLATGMGDSMFSPNLPITRQQMAVMLYALASEYMGLDMSHTATLTGFADGNEVAFWAEEQMAWAVSKGLFDSIPDSQLYLKGESVASRGEVATMLMNFSLNVSA